MPGVINFNVGESDRQEYKIRAVVIEARAIATEQGIKFPKKVSVGGDYSGNGYVCYTSNAVKQLLLDYIQAKGYTLR